MKIKAVLFFLLAVAIAVTAALYRWGDSAHSIGIIKEGGTAKHPAFLDNSSTSYTLIATATVVSSYRGDARVKLEGKPPLRHTIYLAGPVVDLSKDKKPAFKDDILYNLYPKARIALWVKMFPPVNDPVCGMVYEEAFSKLSYEGRDYFFCSDACANVFKKNPVKYKDKETGQPYGKYTLALYDTRTGKSVLRMPVIFKGKEGVPDAGYHHH